MHCACRTWFVAELTGSYLNMVLMLAIVYLIYKILRPSDGKENDASSCLTATIPMHNTNAST